MIKSIIQFVLNLLGNKPKTSKADDNSIKIEEDDIAKDLKLEYEKVADQDPESEILKEETPEQVVEEIVIKDHLLSEHSYFRGPTKKEWVFLHHTAGWENPYRVIDTWDKSPIKIATEFLIGGVNAVTQANEYNGEIVRAFPQGAYAWHLGIGRNKVHTHSVGIELNSFGYLTEGGYYKKVEGKKKWVSLKAQCFYTYTGREVHSDQVIKLDTPFRGYQYWHTYSPAQLKALKKLLEHIRDTEGIDITKGLPELIKKKGAHKAFDYVSLSHVQENPGLWLHTNLQKGKFDLYPHPELVKLLITL